MMAIAASKAAIGRLTSFGTPYIAWLPRVKPCAPTISELMMMRNPSVAIDADVGLMRTIARPLRKATTATTISAANVALQKSSCAAWMKAGSSGRLAVFTAGAR